MDPPRSQRILGQGWKTEGYFEDIVWKNSEKEQGWLLDEKEANLEKSRQWKLMLRWQT
jgi:hypothetical protein